LPLLRFDLSPHVSNEAQHENARQHGEPERFVWNWHSQIKSKIGRKV